MSWLSRYVFFGDGFVHPRIFPQLTKLTIGRGIKIIMRQMGPMIQQMQQTCPDCQGQGETINEKDRCRECNGRKVGQERKVIEVFIEKGMRDQQEIVFTGLADQSPGLIPGDVHVIIDEKPHNFFTRKGEDLFCTVKIELITALCGGVFHIPHLDGRVLVVNIIQGEVITPGQTKCINGEGMPGYFLINKLQTTI